MMVIGVVEAAVSPHRGQTSSAVGKRPRRRLGVDDVARKVRPWRDFEPIDERQRRGFISSTAQSVRRLFMN